MIIKIFTFIFIEFLTYLCRKYGMKKFLFVLSVFFISFSLSAQSNSRQISDNSTQINSFGLKVDENEIRAVSDGLIEFENYGGPHNIIESADAIRGIGINLGNELKSQNMEEYRIIQPGAKYSIIHAVNSEQNELLNADILVFSETAGVDHIDNVRRILNGFLQTTYGYTYEEAQALSVFITIYNAVYRGQFKTFSDKYKTIVLENLSETDSGLSPNWEDWAAHTQIVIPLQDITENNVSPVDTSAISDDKVIETLRNTDDKGIEEREKIVDIKEREVEEATKKAQDAQKTSVQQKKEGNTASAKQSAQTSKQQQQIADRKRNETQTERQKIAEDKASIQTEKNENTETGIFGADKKGFYRLITVNSDTGKINLKSPANQIRNSDIFTLQNITIEGISYPQMFLAICGDNSGKSAVRLCLIDSTNLEIKKESEAKLSPSSELVSYKDDFFAVIEDNKKSYIAHFDKNLNMLHKSQIAVTASTPLNISASGLLVTDSEGNPCLLNLNDLSTIWQAGM